MIRAALAAALLAGCATVGHNFDSASLDWLHEGATKAQIEEKLGQPLRVGSDAGVPTWTYGYYEYRLFGESNNKDLVIRFAPDGTVKSYTMNTSFPKEREQLDPTVAKG